MAIKVKKIRSPKKLADALNKVEPLKRFRANRYLGKINWGENPLEYQKRLRDEWD